MTPEFLLINDVVAIHALHIAQFGGNAGLRDRALLESALAQPMVTFDGAFIHEGLFAMAAAYLFHLVSNHPFVDGNKRTGLLSALVFLDLNGISLPRNSAMLYDLTMAVAQGKASKKEIAEVLALAAEVSH